MVQPSETRITEGIRLQFRYIHPEMKALMRRRQPLPHLCGFPSPRLGQERTSLAGPPEGLSIAWDPARCPLAGVP